MRKDLVLTPYFELTKPRITTMVILMGTFGFLLGGKTEGLLNLPFFLIGLGLTSSGAAALNHFLERDVDSRMERTKDRPIPSGKIDAEAAMGFGIFLTLTGIFILTLFVNLLTAFLCLLAAFLYTLVYTPMKRISWWNTPIGAIPGALPPMAGWAAATGEIGNGGWILFLILFIWQHPHFYAIAWMFRDEYQKAGFKMLSVFEDKRTFFFGQTLFFALILIPISLIPTWLGITGKIYSVGAFLLGIYFLKRCLSFSKLKTFESARGALRASIIYLPFLLLFIILDSGIFIQ